MDNKKNDNKNHEKSETDTGQSMSGKSAGAENVLGRWYEIEEAYRERYNDLTDDEVAVVEGRFDDTVDRIARRRGQTPAEILAEIENW